MWGFDHGAEVEVVNEPHPRQEEKSHVIHLCRDRDLVRGTHLFSAGHLVEDIQPGRLNSLWQALVTTAFGSLNPHYVWEPQRRARPKGVLGSLSFFFPASDISTLSLSRRSPSRSGLRAGVRRLAVYAPKTGAGAGCGLFRAGWVVAGTRSSLRHTCPGSRRRAKVCM